MWKAVKSNVEGSIGFEFTEMTTSLKFRPKYLEPNKNVPEPIISNSCLTILRLLSSAIQLNQNMQYHQGFAINL